jgi:hypothetical protein
MSLKIRDNAQWCVAYRLGAKSMKMRLLRIRNQQVASSILAGGSSYPFHTHWVAGDSNDFSATFLESRRTRSCDLISYR